MARNFQTIDSIIEKLGGTTAISKDLKMSASLIRAWRSDGISWWHFGYVMKKSGVSALQIYKANVLAAGKKRHIPKAMISEIKLEALGVLDSK